MDRPILFSGPMVRSILGGRKTQTRRVLKLPTKTHNGGPICEHPKMGGWAAATVGGKGCYLDPSKTIPAPERACIWHQTTGTAILPPFSPGDRLWVRERWKPGAWREDGRVAVDYDASPELTNSPWIHLPETANWPNVWEKWTDELIAAGSVAGPDGIHRWKPGRSPLRWRPSIHMPRWASRLTLIVTDVRIQRLQEISPADARAEGVRHNNVVDPRAPKPLWDVPGADFGGRHPQEAFAALWDSLNAQRGAPWSSNPWVCAVSFEARKINIDQMEADHG